MRQWQKIAALLMALLGGSVPASAQAPRQSPDREAHAVEPGILEVLDQYAAAFESLDPLAVKKVQPSIDSENLKAAFKQMRSLEVAIHDVRLLSADATATRVSCRVTQTLIPKAGSKQTMAVTRVLRLRKQHSGWVIDAFER